MDDHLSVIVGNFDNHSHYEQSQHEMSKSNYTTMISAVTNNQVTNYQPIIQSLNKEVVTVNPIFKLESEILIHKNIKPEDKHPPLNDVKPMLTPQKRSRGHIDRYNGMTEDEVMQRKLPDYLREGLDLIVVGINPSMTSACVGHHYAGIGNHFWTCIAEAGLVPEQVTCYDDYRMVDYGIGFTNVCSRPTKGAAEISRKEMKAGALIMLEKMRKYRPKIAVFNGKGIYEAFVGHKNFYMGKQPKPLDSTDIMIFVMPSSSARCAQLPRAEDKLPFFIALRKLRDYIKGRVTHLNDQEVIFTDYTEFRVTQPDPKSLRKAERRRKRKAEQMLAVTGSSDQMFNLSKPRKNRPIMNSIQSQKSNSIASTKENDYGVSTHDLTPTTLPDDSTSQIEIPIAVLNQSNGLISLLPSDFLINGSLGGFNISNQNSILTLNNKNNSTLSSGKPIILQQDASGQTYMLATSSPILQNTAISIPHMTTLSANNQQTTATATLMPWGGNNTFALIQPNQIINSNQNNSDNNNSSAISWNGSNISVQGSQQILSQPSNLIYQKTNNTGCQQQIICTAATLQQLLQQQPQHQQIQIVNPLSFSQPITIQAPLGLGSNFGNIQFQQIANCLSESLSTDQMSNGGNEQLLQQETLCQVTCSMTPSSTDNSASVTNGSIQSVNTQNIQSNTNNCTNHDTQSNGHQATIVGYSLAPNSSQSNQSMTINTNQTMNNNQNLTLAYISNQQSLQNLSPTFSTLNNGNTTHIVIPISGTNLLQAGNILQLADHQQQRLICGQGSSTNIMNCFASCGSLTNNVVTNNSATASSNSSTNITDISMSSSGNMNSQMQCSRPMVSSSSSSAISSVAGQNDLDLISSSSGIGETSSAGHLYHQHCTAPIQLADCDDQLVQCSSSSDEKLVYAAL